jgi:serine/threonine protein kinase
MADLPGLQCLRQLDGRPGHDRTFHAVRTADGAEVAVRVFRRTVTTARDRERLEREAAAILALDGEPHIVRMHEFGISASGHPYLVMEYCPAGSLADALDTVGRFTPAEVRRIGVKLAGGLAVSHERGVIHRALTPRNVLIDGRGEASLSNFYLVSVATAHGDFTPPARWTAVPYTAPEAYLPELMTAAGDIYALGAVLYTMLSGAPPRSVRPTAVVVDGDNLADLPRMPWALMSVIRRAMSYDPDDRQLSCAQLADELASA